MLAWAWACGLICSVPTAAHAQTVPSGLRLDGVFTSEATWGGVPRTEAALSAADQAKEPATPKEPEKSASKAPKKPSAPPVFRIAGFFETGYQGLVAKDTFDAVLGKSGGNVIGGGVSLTHQSGIFVQVDATRFKADGERVFVYNSQVYPLGIPLSVTMTPIEFSGGYKFFVRQPKPKTPPPPTTPPKPFFQPARPRPGEGAAAAGTRPADDKPTDQAAAVPRPVRKPRWGGLKPYVGGGFGIVNYEEIADFASTDDDVKDSFTSIHALGGLDIPVWKWIGAAAEVNYRWVRDALGTGGVSKDFGETDLGGPSFRLKITIGG